MASVIAIAVTDVDATRRNLLRSATITFGAGTYVSGGLTMDLTTATNKNNKPYAKFTRTPDSVEVNNQPVGYHMKILPGTLLTNWLVQLFVTGAGNDAIFHEVTNGDSLDATIVADTTIFVQFATQKGH